MSRTPNTPFEIALMAEQDMIFNQQTKVFADKAGTIEGEIGHGKNACRICNIMDSIINDIFSKMSHNVASPICLLCIPKQLAESALWGTNTVLRLFTSEAMSEECMAWLEELNSKIEDHSDGYLDVLHIPKIPEIAGLINNRTDYTLSECFWLIQLCQLLSCVDVMFSKHLNDVITSYGSAENVDFRQTLDPSNAKHLLLREATHEQYMLLTSHLLVIANLSWQNITSPHAGIKAPSVFNY